MGMADAIHYLWMDTSYVKIKPAVNPFFVYSRDMCTNCDDTCHFFDADLPVECQAS